MLNQSYSFRNTPKRLVLNLKNPKRNEKPSDHLKLNEENEDINPKNDRINVHLNITPSVIEPINKTTSDISLDASHSSQSEGTYKFKPVEQICELNDLAK